jgi:hypothetical protein
MENVHPLQNVLAIKHQMGAAHPQQIDLKEACGRQEIAPRQEARHKSPLPGPVPRQFGHGVEIGDIELGIDHEEVDIRGGFGIIARNCTSQNHHRNQVLAVESDQFLREAGDVAADAVRGVEAVQTVQGGGRGCHVFSGFSSCDLTRALAPESKHSDGWALLARAKLWACPYGSILGAMM